MEINICLVSANEIYREGLGRILEGCGFTLHSSYESIEELENDELDPYLLYLLDSVAPAKQPKAVERIIERDGSVKVVVLADSFEVRPMLSCLEAGAQGYIIKSNESLPLTSALQLAAVGRKVLPSEAVELFSSHSFASQLVFEGGQDLAEAKLSPRELDVLCCLMAGYANKVIARKLNVCEATVKVHVKAILRKLNVRNRTQAAIWASSRGLSEMPPSATGACDPISLTL